MHKIYNSLVVEPSKTKGPTYLLENPEITLTFKLIFRKSSWDSILMLIQIHIVQVKWIQGL